MVFGHLPMNEQMKIEDHQTAQRLRKRVKDSSGKPGTQ